MSLDSVQQEIIDTTSGESVVVTAVPGAGKTRTVIARISDNISKGIRTLAFTFTKNAANEIRARLNSDKAIIGTIHSVCLQHLRDHGEQRPIISDYGMEKTVKLISTEYSKTPAEIYTILNQALEMCIPMWGYRENILKRYQDIKKQLRVIDFSDIMSLFVSSDYPLTGIDELIVDEYQDINTAQQRVINKILDDNPGSSFFFVGDPMQSIYEFRGSNPEILESLITSKDNLYHTKNRTIRYHTKRLSVNYRSGEDIIHAANGVANRKIRGYQILPAPGHIRGEVSFKQSYNVISEILEDITPDTQTAILTRTNTELREIETSLIRNKIPHVVVNNISFYKKREIKDLIAVIEAIAIPTVRYPWERIMKFLPRFGSKALEKFFESGVDSLKGKAVIKARECLRKITSGDKPSDILWYLMNNVYYDYIDKISKGVDESDDRKENCRIFIQSISKFTSARDALDEILTLSNSAVNTNINLQLLTMHSAKGLEWDKVIIPFCNEGAIPHAKCISEFNTSEENRLFFVAVTRAKKILRLYADQRRAISRYVMDIYYHRPSVIRIP